MQLGVSSNSGQELLLQQLKPTVDVLRIGEYLGKHLLENLDQYLGISGPRFMGQRACLASSLCSRILFLCRKSFVSTAKAII
ncbi:hypothetical protein ZIOFF_061149 [Zingiber officinale]|uniref:Uncharacterized protein n=1 Tax=Zingiber officinale TaxID=94328 RepID=A0A8J5KEB1_ZINOF|nr:hypothetical protein ZIOFF_061149 [Zingiber officinale]